MKRNKTREKIIEVVKQSLQEEELLWRKPWISQKPYNACSNASYSGMNLFILYWASQDMQYNDPRWCTFNQANKMGWKIKKGSKGVPIEFWSHYDKKIKKNLTHLEVAMLDRNYYLENITIVSRVYHVFNAQQFLDIPPLLKTEQVINKEYDLAENVLSKYLVEEKISIINSFDQASYFPKEDVISIPTRQSFESVQDYYAVLAHECGHSTMANQRMPRNIRDELSSKQNYAIEELRAEISSFFLCGDLGISMQTNHNENHKAYIQSWLEILDKKPNELYRAITDAQKISDYILEKGDYENQLQLAQDRHLELTDELTWEVEDGILQP